MLEVQNVLENGSYHGLSILHRLASEYGFFLHTHTHPHTKKKKKKKSNTKGECPTVSMTFIHVALKQYKRSRGGASIQK